MEIQPIPQTPQTTQQQTPQVIFVIPYRNRAYQLERWIQHMIPLLNKESFSYRVFVVHQKDSRRFNRGAMRNIGFLRVKHVYPTTYRTITLVFQDVDTLPNQKITYTVSPGTVRHYFGYKFAFGGMVSMNAGDFERIGGYPNFWSWGLEDNLLRERWILYFGETSIDYSEFVKIQHVKQIIHKVERDEFETIRTEYATQPILFDTSGERGRDVEVQHAQYASDLRRKNKKEYEQKRGFTESIHSIKKIKMNESALESIIFMSPSITSLVSTLSFPVEVCDIHSFDCRTTDSGIFEHRRDLKKLRHNKVLSMNQLVTYQNRYVNRR